MRTFFRLYQNQSVIRSRVSQFVRKKSAKVTEQIEKTVSCSSLSTLIVELRDKIKFNSYLEREKLDLGYYKFYVKSLRKAEQISAKNFKEKSLPPLPVALKYINNNNSLLDNNEVDVSLQENTFQLPFSNPTNINISPDNKGAKEFNCSNLNRWMTSYEHFDDSKLSALQGSEDDDIDGLEWCKNYGTPDPKVGISRVPCGGCGALLHCSDPAIPGYLPSEIIKGRTDEDLKIIECQRCHFLKEYNIALDVTVQPEEYENLLQIIRYGAK